MLAPLHGFLLPFHGLKLILHPKVRPYVVVPLLLNILVFALLAWAAISYFDLFMAEYLPEEAWWSFFRPLLWLIFAAAYALAMFYGFTILANLIASPFNGALAARVEQVLSGRVPSDSELSIAASIGPAIKGELDKLAYFLKRAIPLLLLFVVASFIPGLNLIATALWVGFGFWFLALEYADYPMGNHDIAPAEQRSRLANKRMKSLGFGAGVSLLMLVLGFVAMPAAVAAATRYWVEDMQQGA